MSCSYVYNELDMVRTTSGISGLKMRFQQIVRNNQSRAVHLLNDQTLSFPSFYLLIPQINAYHLEEYLSLKNQSAIAFTQNNPIDDISPASDFLKWMLLSSIKQELDDDTFQEVIDRVVIQLLLVFHEHALLPMVVQLIFVRNRKDQCIYDLCWAVYQAQTVLTMSLIAKQIKSNHKKDQDLAYKLLNFKPELQPKDRYQQYHNFCRWFEENKPFLHFANESMQETCQPKYWRVNLPAKYLCKNCFNDDLFSESEQEQINAFLSLNRPSQKILSKYSYRLYQKDQYAWQKWIESSIDMQLDACSKELEGK